MSSPLFFVDCDLFVAKPANVTVRNFASEARGRN